MSFLDDIDASGGQAEAYQRGATDAMTEANTEGTKLHFRKIAAEQTGRQVGAECGAILRAMGKTLDEIQQHVQLSGASSIPAVIASNIGKTERLRAEAVERCLEVGSSSNTDLTNLEVPVNATKAACAAFSSLQGRINVSTMREGATGQTAALQPLIAAVNHKRNAPITALVAAESYSLAAANDW